MPISESVWWAASVLSTASPRAAPMKREVLSTPEASPLTARGTPFTATIVAGTSASPSPKAPSRPPGSTFAR